MSSNTDTPEEYAAENYFGEKDTIGFAAIVEMRQPLPLAPPTPASTPGERHHLLPLNRDIEMGSYGATGGGSRGSSRPSFDQQPQQQQDVGEQPTVVMCISKAPMLDQVMVHVIGMIDLLVDHRKCFGADAKTYNYQICYDVEDENLFICASKADKLPARICFSFLQALKEEWWRATSHKKLPEKELLKLQRTFAKTMDEQMIFYGSNPAADKLRKLKAKVDLTTDVMLGNIAKLLARGEKLDHISTKAEHMQDKTNSFKKRTFEVRRYAWMKHMKACICLAGTIVCAIISLIGLAIALYYFNKYFLMLG